MLEISKIFTLGGYIVTVGIEKEFNSLSHYFLIACLKKLGFAYDFLQWVKILLESKESCIINAEITTSYFILKKGAH